MPAMGRRKKLALLLLMKRRRRLWKRKSRRFAVHPILREREPLGEFHHLFPQLLKDTDRFKEYFRMEPSTFYELLELCRGDLQKESTNFKQPISPEERLSVTLRFLSSGESFISLGFHFRIGVSTVHNIVKETVQAIWTRLQPTEMCIPDEKGWEKISEDFFEKWQFPLCLGAIDGKHVRIKAPIHSGSQFYNYKGYHSIVLMAIADANAKFVVVDVGAYGSSSDGGIFQDSVFCALLRKGKLKLPLPKRLPGTDINLPHVFIGDEAFPLLQNLMRPFPRRSLTDEKRIFNYRLSRARLQVERAFGIMSSMWRLLRTTIEVQVDFAVEIVKAIICVLHNYVQNREPQRMDNFDNIDLPCDQNDTIIQHFGKFTEEAVSIRTSLMRYFQSPSGSLSWQRNVLS